MRLATFTSLVALALLGAVAPASAQTFVFGAQGEPVQFDPAVITDGISSRITRQVFDGLVKYKGATTEAEVAVTPLKLVLAAKLAVRNGAPPGGMLYCNSTPCA